jgi:glycosyltransferase involved in cell wall biosynthesis
MLGDESIPVVYNGVDVDAIPFSDEPEDFFLIAGRMVPEKGIADAIRIATKNKSKLVIVGHVTSHLPWSEQYFLQEIKPHVDGVKVRYIERLPHRDLARLMSKAKAFLFPIKWDEPFGMVVVEAMAAGTPVLAYARGAMPELIKHGETGYLVQSEDEMIAAMQRLDVLDRGRCRAWVREHFSVGEMIEGYVTLYKNVVRRPRGREIESQPNRVL